MYSALKVNGKKLYELAREGKEVDRKARPVTILELVITRIELPRVWMRVSCSKGTYIRTLCSDIGEKLGCGGTMESLVRTRVERFFLEEAMTLDEIERARDEDTLADRIVSIEDMFSRYEKAQTIKEADSLVRNGNPLKLSELSWQEGGQTTEKAIIRVCDSSGRFMGIYRFEQERQFYKPWKMFLNAEM